LLPNVFEAELCERLINLYRASQPEDSGFMREESGLTVSAIDHAHKQRRDVGIADEVLIGTLKQRVIRRVVPEIRKAFQFNVTRMERYIVAGYSDVHGGHFKPHRDNTTKGTAHRRFALSVNLNDDYEGAEIGFPEFGDRTYKTGAGGAVVFSCSLLHTVKPIRRGTRFVFLPFLYDDAAAAIREENNRYLGDGVNPYNVAPESGTTTRN
jgi:predicted 2-oxoglutarate/Fe(II)-dependent dioxygenase YbiX